MLSSIALTAQPVNPANTPDQMMPGGPYPNVQNTGADQCWCPTCPLNVAQVYCWDGDNPGIAYYVPGSGNPPHVLPLPAGAQDPDIIVGREGLWGYVVYEMGTNIVLHEFTCSPPVATTLAFGSATILSTNGRHPNIDREIDCEFSGSKVAVVYQNLSGIPDLEYYEGTFNSSFNGPLPVLNLSFPNNAPIRSYVNRTNPDINILKFDNDYIYQFAFCGYENNVYFDNMVDYVHETSSFISSNIFSPEIPLSINNLYEVNPRIDGNVIVFDPPQNIYTDQSYIITVESNNQIFFSYANSPSPSWTDINIPGTFAQKPAIAVHGDFADIIWSNNFHGNINILGTEIHGTIHSSIYKDGNVNITSGYDFLYPSIASNMCDKLTDLYAVCWWGTDENIYFKAARTPPSPAYRYQYPDNAIVFFKDKYEQSHMLVETFDVNQHITIHDISGKILFTGIVSEAQHVIIQFPKGIYLITSNNAGRKKLLIQ